MTIAGWIGAIIVLILSIVLAIAGYTSCSTTKGGWTCAIIIMLAGLIVIGGMIWYFNGTAAGRRQLLDEHSNLSNGLERDVTIYTADGKVLAEYHGRIDIEANQDYVKFDFNGKRYIYYNCFVETIATIP